MRLRTVLVLLALLVLAAPVAAQGTKGSSKDDPLNPSGSIPWAIPAWPYLLSPTPYPIRPSPAPQLFTVTPTPTPTPTLTPTITPTPAPNDAERESLATLAAENSDINATLAAMTGQEIGGQNISGAVDQIGGYASFFFGYVKGLQLNNIHGMGMVISFLILALAAILLTKIITAVLPMMTTVARWTLDVLKLVAEFLPF